MDPYPDLEILLIEDNLNDAELAIRALKKNNLAKNILHLSDGEEALDFICAKGNFADRDQAKTPKFILLDLKLPKVDGFEVLKTIRQHEPSRLIPVVILSSSGEERDIQECYRLGVNSYVVKPVAFDIFVETVYNLGKYWLQSNLTPAAR